MSWSSFFFISLPTPISTPFPYTTLFRSDCGAASGVSSHGSARPSSCSRARKVCASWNPATRGYCGMLVTRRGGSVPLFITARSEEHTSELQSHSDLVCRLLLEKKKKIEH